MKSRIIPCTECRKQRRKCIPTFTKNCSRCQRLGKECMQPIPDIKLYTEQEVIQGQKIQNQLVDLQWAIHQLETQMQSLSCNSLGNESSHQVQHSVILPSIEHQWKIQIKNGTFRLETGIKNISDLLSIQLNGISYLSPLSCYNSSSSSESSSSGHSESSRESRMLMHFDTKAWEGISPFTMKLFSLWTNRIPQSPTTHLLPAYLRHDPISLMDQLIAIYFTCHNEHVAMIHENSFIEKYIRLKNPLDDLISVSICTYVCSVRCNHTYCLPSDEKAVGEYFFSLAKSAILDQFDLPEKKLDTVISINLISKYLQAQVRYHECNKFIDISYQICLDLLDEFKTPPKSYQDEINRALFSRHITTTTALRRLLHRMFQIHIDEPLFNYPKWIILNDEHEKVKKMITFQNELLRLMNHPYVGQVLVQVQKAQLGDACTLTFESIVVLEDVIAEWVKSFPSEFRLCDNVKNVEQCIKAIDETDEYILLYSFIYCQLFITNIYSHLLKPVPVGKDYDDLCQCVQQRSLENTQIACKLLLYAIRRISKLQNNGECYYAISASDFLFSAADAFLLLVMSPNQHIAKESFTTLNSCLQDIDRINYTQKQNHHDEYLSPFNKKQNILENTKNFDFNYYDRYPNPRNIVTYDATKYILNLKIEAK